MAFQKCYCLTEIVGDKSSIEKEFSDNTSDVCTENKEKYALK